MGMIITVILLIVVWIITTKPSGERKGCLLLLFLALYGLFMLFYTLGKRDMEEHSYNDYQNPSYLDTGTYVIDKPALTDEEQYIISEIEIEHGVNIGMYEMMDPNFPPKDAVKWENGRYYHKSDIEKYYVDMGKTGYWKERLKKDAKPLRPANPFEGYKEENEEKELELND